MDILEKKKERTPLLLSNGFFFSLVFVFVVRGASVWSLLGRCGVWRDFDGCIRERIGSRKKT